MPLPAPAPALGPLSGRTRKLQPTSFERVGGGDVSQNVVVVLARGLGAPRCTARALQPSWKMSAPGREERSGPPGSYAKRVLVTGGAGFM